MNVTHMILWRSLRKFVLMGSAIGAMVFLAGCGSFTSNAQGNMGTEINSDDVAYLAGFGDWITVQPYGEVWQPWVSAGWRPFSYGDWSWSDPDWDWVSYEPYGWLVYHYGEWGYRPGIGWFWVPGDTWSGAQVEWYTWDDYTAWAPIPPDGIEWGEPWGSDEGLDFDAWTTVRLGDFDNHDIGNYRLDHVPRAHTVTDLHEFRHQPQVQIVQRSTDHQIQSRTLRTSPIHMGPREYKRMNLYPEQRKVVAIHQRDVSKHVLVSREQFHERMQQEHEQRAREAFHESRQEHASAGRESHTEGRENHGESSGRETHGNHHRR